MRGKRKVARRAAVFLTTLGLIAIAGCGDSSEARGESTGAAAVLLGPENIIVADSALLESGPIVTGSLTAENEADIRAQVSGTVLQVNVEPGDRVSKGTLLAKIEAHAIREAYVSAQSGVRSSEAALTVARRNLERAERLAAAGAIAERELENARTDVTDAEAAAADAHARLSSAARQLSNTEIRAPFTGIVSERPVDVGDVVQLGTAMVTVVDPSRMLLEASVPAEQLSQVRVNAPVSFRVNGYAGRVFTGAVDLINPTVDATTRQVRIYVSIPNTGNSLVAGLFAEGRVSAETRTGVVVPRAAVDTRGLRPIVMRIENGRVEKVEVELGLEDPATESIELTRGVAAGDTLLLGSAQGITPGTAARVRSAAERVDTTTRR